MAMTKEEKILYNKEYRLKNREKRREIERASAIKLKLKHPLRPILWNTKRECLKNGIVFNIKESDLELPTYCPLLGIKLQTNFKSRKDNSYSIDRINPKLGYIKGNVWVVSWRANNLKKDASWQELMTLAINLKSKVSEVCCG